MLYVCLNTGFLEHFGYYSLKMIEYVFVELSKQNIFYLWVHPYNMSVQNFPMTREHLGDWDYSCKMICFRNFASGVTKIISCSLDKHHEIVFEKMFDSGTKIVRVEEITKNIFCFWQKSQLKPRY